MLNIISRSIVDSGINGPQKVVNNLIKGLDILNYPYCLNKDLNTTSQLWIHDDPIAIKNASKRHLKAIIGPNIYILPRSIPKNLNMSNFIYIQPSKWALDFWRDFGFDKCKTDFWPTGIDTEEFSERKKSNSGIVLIYFKQRYKEELDFVKNILDNLKIQYEIIIYGLYDQKDYLKKLQNTRYVIWLGRQESQGIALEEALSMNVPILVWDVLNVGHWVPNKKEKKIFNQEELNYKNTTSAFYFSDECGIITKDKEKIKESINNMENSWQSYEPRKYIIENLNLEQQARDFIELFYKYYNISYDDGKKEHIISNKKWHNDKIYFKKFVYIKSIIKKCIKTLKKY